jgi:hypothetical protein
MTACKEVAIRIWHALWPWSFCRGEYYCETCGRVLR